MHHVVRINLEFENAESALFHDAVAGESLMMSRPLRALKTRRMRP